MGSSRDRPLKLPHAGRAKAACANLDALAASLKRAGDPRTLDQLRSDIYLALLSGDHVREEPAGGEGGPADTGQADTDTGPDADAGYAASADEGRHVGVPVNGEATAVPVQSPRASGGAGVEVRLELATLLGWNQHPGELPGWGPVPAHAARAVVRRHTGAQWRFAITDSTGHLLSEGTTRDRPAGHVPPDAGRGPGGIVEIHVPLTLLNTLRDDPELAPGWRQVIADLYVQYHRPAPAARHTDVTRRFPGAAVRRRLQVRDRHCLAPGCRAPATTCDQDHTTDHSDGGPTTESNLASLCRHDHMLKHKGGWGLSQPEPGVLLWTTPLGHRYLVEAPPVIPDYPPPLHTLLRPRRPHLPGGTARATWHSRPDPPPPDSGPPPPDDRPAPDDGPPPF